MRKLILLASVLLSSSVVFAQSVVFVRNGEVIPNASTVTVSEVEHGQMNPKVLVRNNGNEAVEATLKVTSIEGFSNSISLGICGFGTEQCAPIRAGQSVSRTTTINPNESIDPVVDVMGNFTKVDATITYELSAGGEVVSTITIKFLYDASPINSVDAATDIIFNGNELTYNFDNAATRQLNVYNVTGSLVKSEALETSGTVVLNNMNKGVYIYEVIENGKRIAAHKCVIR